MTISLPFLVIRGCDNCGKCMKAKAINDSTIIADSLKLVDAVSKNLNSDSLRNLIQINKQKQFDITNDTCFNWDSFRGYQLLNLTIATYYNVYDTKSADKTRLLILIDIAIIIQLVGLIFVFIKRLQKTRLKFILSFVGLLCCLLSIALLLQNKDLIKIDYGLWLFSFVSLIIAITDLTIYKRLKNSIKIKKERMPSS